MIPANELRLGNLVEFGNTPLRMSAHAMRDVFSREYNKQENLLKPIPLTPELLERAGFEYESNHNADGDEVEWLEHPKLKGITYRNAEFHRDLGTVVIVNIKSIHQLQNLFFALTGEELKIEL